MSTAALNFSVCRQYTEVSSVQIRSHFRPNSVINCKLPCNSRLFSQNFVVSIADSDYFYVIQWNL
ncbi:hypothetical protein HanLR1_Chr11g0387751 [Helianthus annuus]|nr:hypothetical protein HanLR1_Chr11g0387751 [Helianthus annuus]